MAQCVSMDSAGVLTVLVDPPLECPGFVLLSGSEYVAVSINQGIFAMPTVEQAGAFFSASLAVPVVLYVIARCAGSVVNMFR